MPRIQSALISKAAPLAVSRAAPPELGGPVPAHDSLQRDAERAAGVTAPGRLGHTIWHEGLTRCTTAQGSRTGSGGSRVLHQLGPATSFEAVQAAHHPALLHSALPQVS